MVEALARVGASALAGRAPQTLSPGELQRVALARALVRVRRGARLLLLDEPTAHLDDDARALVAEVLLGLRGTVTTVLVPTTRCSPPWPTAPSTSPPPSPGGPAGTARRPPRGAGAPTSTPPAAGTGRPRRHRCAGRWRRAVAAGALSSGAGIALTAVSGWLIVRAAEMPPILTLMVAIVGVRFFGLGPGAAALAGADDRPRRRPAAGRRHPGAGVGGAGRAGPRRRPDPRLGPGPGGRATSAWCRT